MVNEPYVPEWRARAERVGLRIWCGKKVYEMSELEIEEAFKAFGKEYGIHYVWSSK